MNKVALCVGLIVLLLIGSAMAATEETKQTAIDNGLAWLAATQTTSGAEGYWSYPYDGTIAATASAALAFIEEGYLPGDGSMYDGVVTKAVTYIFNRAAVDSRFGVEPAYGYPFPRYAEDYDNDGVFDDGNDQAIAFGLGGAEPLYNTGIVAPVVFALGNALGKNTVITVGSSAINGKTYAQAMQDIVDWISWGQVEPNMGVYRGGWRYDANYSSSDGSTAQWGALPLLYAAAWGLGVPSYVFTELEMWVNYIQDPVSGGVGYDSPTSMVSISKTGSLLLELVALGAGTSDSRVVAALNYINNEWNTTANGTWYGNFNNPYAMWAVYKGLQVIGYMTSLNCGPGNILVGEGIPAAPGGFTICFNAYPATSVAGDWFSHYCDYLVGIQNGDGSWNGYDYWTGALATGWYINILNATKIVNQPPVAICQDDTVAADEKCLADASIDNGSYDPDGDSITLTQTPPGPYPLGDTQVMLTVTDSYGLTSTCSATVTVIDTTPPDITVSLNRDVLWPPNHKMADIVATVTVTDNCENSCTPPTFKLISATSNEPDNGKGDGNTTGDIQGADIGTPDVAFQLRSERSGTGDGRIYTIVYEARDCSGNTATATAEVRVPHDHAGWACASMGFETGGLNFDPALDRFVLIIRSKAAEYTVGASGERVLVSEAFDATALDMTRTYVGNVKDVTLPNERLVIDNNADGLMDVAVYYSAKAVNGIIYECTKTYGDKVELDASWGAIGLHYVSASGVDYLVPNIFQLGEPVPIVPPIDMGRSGGMNGNPEPSGHDGDTPVVTTLGDMYPNPFNPSATIPFNLVSQGRVLLRIYDANGKLVRTLANEVMPAGLHRVVWDGRDNSGSRVATGVYFVRFVSGDYSMTKKLVMIK